MKGGEGDDLMSGNGAARMFGQEGDDVFAFWHEGGSDRAKDFDVKEDVVGLSPDMFTLDIPVGYLGKAHFRVGKVAQTPAEVVLYNKKTGALLVDPDGTGAMLAFQAGILPDHLNLKANDILVGFFV
jgi:Ca2+-binding RTX toxin-like protein